MSSTAARPEEASRHAPSEVLGFGALLALGINGIVGVGIFFTPSQIAVLLPGRSGALAYLFTALALMPVACVYAVLGGRFRQDGGPSCSSPVPPPYPISRRATPRSSPLPLRMV